MEQSFRTLARNLRAPPRFLSAFLRGTIISSVQVPDVFTVYEYERAEISYRIVLAVSRRLVRLPVHMYSASVQSLR